MSVNGELRLHIRKVRGEMARERVAAVYSASEAESLYLSGRETGRILLTQSSAILWVKELYYELYRDLYGCGGYPFDVRVHEKADVERHLRGFRGKALGVSQAGSVPALRKASGRRIVVCDPVKAARMVKTRWELDAIRKSCNIAKAGMRKAYDVVALGVRELDAVAEVEGELRRRGSEKAPFGGGMLLASGKGAADIHAKASLKRIVAGPVVVDLGAVFRGYNSDMTRTIAVGRLKPKEKGLMSLVEDVRDEAIGMIRPGMTAASVHNHVDARIKDAGYKFHHLSGHGVGLDIHESPNFSPESKVRLAPGMVFTVEPGIYLPGECGVRFEDTVVLERGGCRKLT